MIYVIYNEGNKHIKIGFSNNSEKRLKELQTGNGNKLILLHKQEGTIQDEKNIHNKLKNYCLIGEWYEYNKIRHILPNLLQGWVSQTTTLSLKYINTLKEYSLRYNK